MEHFEGQRKKSKSQIFMTVPQKLQNHMRCL